MRSVHLAKCGVLRRFDYWTSRLQICKVQSNGMMLYLGIVMSRTATGNISQLTKFDLPPLFIDQFRSSSHFQFIHSSSFACLYLNNIFKLLLIHSTDTLLETNVPDSRSIEEMSKIVSHNGLSVNQALLMFMKIFEPYLLVNMVVFIVNQMINPLLLT